MPPLSPEQVEGILRRLDFLRTEAGDIESFKAMTLRDFTQNRDRRRSLERLAENVANAIVDVSKIVLESSDLPVPNTYREVVLSLAAARVLEEPLAKGLGTMIRLRNIVAHEYLDIRWTTLRRFVEEAPEQIDLFCQRIESLPGLRQL